jgi:hypothetical protein
VHEEGDRSPLAIAVELPGDLGRQQVRDIARGEKTLGPLGPAHGGHEVVSEGGAPRERAPDGALTRAPVQRCLQPAGPRPDLGVRGDAPEPRGVGFHHVHDPERLEEGLGARRLRPARQVAQDGGLRPHRVAR